jgi:hypothetical protein
VHSSERTRITRLFLPGRTVIRKEPLGPDAERRVFHEAAILERLLGVAGWRSWRRRRSTQGRSCLRLGARITLHSPPGNGTTLHVELPLPRAGHSS